MYKKQHRYFICEKCQLTLIGKPAYAKTIWVRMMNLGRHHADKQQWNTAVKAYGNAFDVMDILLDEKTTQQSGVNDYIRTGLEMIYAIRHSTFSNNLPLLVSIIENRVDTFLQPANTRILIKPISDVAYKPLPEVIEILTGVSKNDSAYLRSIH